MITIIRNGTVFAPKPLGRKDILVLGEKVGALAEPGTLQLKGLPVKVVEAEGLTVLPGFIDSHVHILGGGGEGGPATRAPEIEIEDIIRSGVTTLIGCLGTDGVTRHPSSLLAKARGLEAEGVTVFVFIGWLPNSDMSAPARSLYIRRDTWLHCRRGLKWSREVNLRS